MSELDQTPPEEKVAEEKAARVWRRPLWHWPVRAVGWTALSVIALLAVMVLGFDWYSKTADFQRRVGGEVVKILEDSTGGRVELGHLSFDLWHLAIEVDGLTIHGLEGPGDVPYLAADKIVVRVEIITFVKRAAGSSSSGSHIGLNLLRVEQPRVHLMVDKDGKTNQPEPKHPRTSNEPLMDTLLDLKAKEVYLVNGIALLNNRAIPFDAVAKNMQTEVHYLSSSDRYAAVLDMNDLRTKMANEPEVRSRLHVEAEAGRDVAELKKLEFRTGASLTLTATGTIEHFAQPVWQATAKGSMELKQISLLSGLDGLNAGSVDLNVQGHSCSVTPAVAQKQPRFWQRKQAKEEQAQGAKKTLPPDPECKQGYLLVGNVKLHNAGYRNEYVRLHDVNGGADLHVTPTELLFTALTGYLPGGGEAEGELRIEDWLGEAPQNVTATSPTVVAAAKTVNTAAKGIGAKAPIKDLNLMAKTAVPARAYMQVTLTKIPLRTVMDVTAPEGYGDLGFDTAVSGPAKLEWGGPAKDITTTVRVDGDLTFAPTGVKRAGALSNIPVNGTVLAHYTGETEVVNISRLNAQTPQSTLNVSGVLGVDEGDPLTNLKADLEVRDLGEYDQLLQTLDFEANGKKGSAAIPVVLHGVVNFHGTAVGALREMEVKGHVEGDHVEAKLGTVADVLVDSVVGDADYTPKGVSVASSTIKRGTAVLNVSGTFKPREVVGPHGVVTYEWDSGLAVDAKVQLANAQVQDVVQIAGQQKKISLTGTMNVDAHATGTLKDMTGAGKISLVNGVAYGEPYQSAVMNVTMSGQDVEVSSATLMLHGVSITGNGGYDLGSERLHGHLQGNNLTLSKFKTVADSKLNADGVVSLVADADGTLKAPNLKVSGKVAGIQYDGQTLGDATVEAHSSGQVLSYTANSTLVGATLAATGQTQMTGDFQTQAKVTLSGLDIAKPMAMFGSGSVKATSSIGGTVTVDGPLKTPMAMSGAAELNNFDIKLQGVELKTVEPLQVSLKDGIATLQQVHITGEDTDLRASGTVQLFGATDAKGGRLNVRGTGSVSMALTHTFDPDLISSGRVSFTVVAGGQVKKPSLTGRVRFEKVNLAMDGVPNGLSDVEGTLVFDQDRLNVESLTAMTGGGQVKIGGFLTYQNGIYANLTATGDVVRVRLYGLSATGNASFMLQGGPQSALLSGNVLITRFGVGADVDFAAFSGAGGVSAPPDPDAASNKIRLDVHVTSAPQLDFQNSYAKLAGTVDLKVGGTVASPSMLGRIQITDGSATFAGTKYQVQRGDIYFTNPVRIDPTIDLDVTARVENYDVTVGLHGTVTNIKPTYRSEPPLSEADVFNLLALGRTQEEAQLYQEQQVQAGTDPTTSALLGGALNATVSSRVSKLFGAGSVKIDPAFVGTLGNASARVTVQEPLSRQLTLTFATNVNETAQQLIQLQYDINASTSIVATRDESGVFSIVYKIRKRYR